MYNIFKFKFFAGTNFFMMTMQLFSVVQMVLLIMLLWNFEAYLYDFRITRYFSALFAGIFDLFYIMVLAKTFELIIYKSKFLGNPTVVDVISAVIHAFFSVFFLPTFYVNSLILLKELTMNQ